MPLAPKNENWLYFWGRGLKYCFWTGNPWVLCMILRIRKCWLTWGRSCVSRSSPYGFRWPCCWRTSNINLQLNILMPSFQKHINSSKINSHSILLIHFQFTGGVGRVQVMGCWKILLRPFLRALLLQAWKVNCVCNCYVICGSVEDPAWRVFLGTLCFFWIFLGLELWPLRYLFRAPGGWDDSGRSGFFCNASGVEGSFSGEFSRILLSIPNFGGLLRRLRIGFGLVSDGDPRFI